MKSEQETPEETNRNNDRDERETPSTPWWKQMLTRREANTRIARIGITSALLAAAGIGASGCGDDDDDEDVERDALELQQKEGWNVGAPDRSLPLANVATTDSRGTLDWSAMTDSAALLKAYAPHNAAWQPYVVPTLVQALAQPTLRSQIRPVHTNAMDAAYSRGLGMRDILTKSKNASTTVIIADLPGPEAVAYAAALADVADPVMTFDNWPHPIGVVPSQATLGAMIYYAGEVAEKSAKRPADAPAVLMLDSNRLAPFHNPDTEFDNRYLAKIPASDKLVAMKITNVMYAVPDSSRTVEMDDLNEDIAAYKDKGINVSLVALTDFQPDTSGAADSTDQASTGYHGYHHATYFYGGGLMYSPWFFYHYPVFVSSYGLPARSRLPSTSLGGRSYTPVRRPTMFSSRTSGGRSGVGRQRPTGFGRVSTRVGSDGRTTGVRSGSYGSYGRSRGGYGS